MVVLHWRLTHCNILFTSNYDLGFKKILHGLLFRGWIIISSSHLSEEFSIFFSAGSGQNPARNLARGPWVLSISAQARFWIAWPSPKYQKILHLSQKMGQIWSKLSAWAQPEPKTADLGQKKLAWLSPNIFTFKLQK